MNNPVWCEKYRPKTVSETILPAALKKTFQEFVDKGQIPNLILNGNSGVGKTTIAKAVLNEIGSDYITINASMNGNIDTLRVDIMNFASSVSFSGGRKFVILDEADHLNPSSTQPALRNFMEEYSANCGFILTVNFKNRIIEPLKSRCSMIDFVIPNDEKQKLAVQFFKRTQEILDKEGVEYKPNVVAELIQLYFPDWRRCLNELQRYSISGKIDEGILTSSSEGNYTILIEALKKKDFNLLRKWVGENSDIDAASLYRKMYDILPVKLSNKNAIASSILILAEYEYKEAFVANSEINRVACLASIMVECDGAWL